jgi:predicted nucleotidyltransferase
MGRIEAADRVIATLREHAVELRAAGIRHLALFGSFARGNFDDASDIDLLAELDPAARIGLIGLAALERRIADLLGRRVDLTPEPIEAPWLRSAAERDKIDAF